MDSSNVVALPVTTRRSCHNCKFAAHGAQTWCTVVREPIFDERSAAADCEVFQDEERE